jgi:hypothetical protein
MIQQQRRDARAKHLSHKKNLHGEGNPPGECACDVTMMTNGLGVTKW